jgi:hypothetical protein
MRDIEDFLAAASGGVVPEAPAEEAPHLAGSELAISLAAAEPGEPLVASGSGLTEGVSDDVLSEAASREEGGETDG